MVLLIASVVLIALVAAAIVLVCLTGDDAD